jgi:hypothetical protein
MSSHHTWSFCHGTLTRGTSRKNQVYVWGIEPISAYRRIQEMRCVLTVDSTNMDKNGAAVPLPLGFIGVEGLSK